MGTVTAYVSIMTGRIERMSYADLQTALEALWAARNRPSEPVKPVMREEVPF